MMIIKVGKKFYNEKEIQRTKL